VSKIFVTSDTHFWHRNIITYSNRPFSSVEDMNDTIKSRWNKVVKPKDTVYFLGDLAMGSGATTDSARFLLRQLNGKIKFVLGNHDEGKTLDIVEAARMERFKVEILRDVFRVKIAGVRYVMSHYPIHSWQGKTKGAIHLHGHSHTPLRMFEGQRENRFDIGIDMYGKPVDITNGIKELLRPKGWQ